MLTKRIRPCQWKLLLYTDDDSTVDKRIWLVAQVADKWPCKNAQPMLLESENISVVAEDTMCTIFKASHIHFCKLEKVCSDVKVMTLQAMQSGECETDLSGSYPAWIRVALYRWAAVSCP